MKTLVLVAALVALIAAALAMAKLNAKKATGNRSAPTPRQALTKREQSMYFRLVQALPEHVVLAQVAFSALITAKDRATRSTFDRKVADFVVCTKAFEVAAVIELDDATHKGKERADGKRDTLLQAAGYRVLRYANVPDTSQVQGDFKTPAPHISARQTDSASTAP